MPACWASVRKRLGALSRKRCRRNEQILFELEKLLIPIDHAARSSERARPSSWHCPGTATWIVESDEYQRWRTPEQRGILWIMGDTGTGKSILTETIAARLIAQERVPVLYFSFKRTIPRLREPKSLICDLVYQLIRDSQFLQNDFERLIADGQNSLADVSVDELWNMFISLLVCLPPVYCIVDALDELCLVSQPFLDKLIGLSHTRPNTIKVLVTSRSDLRKLYQYQDVDFLQITLLSQLTCSDVAVYVRYRMNKIVVPHKAKSQIRTTICGKADGNFLYARLAMDYILYVGRDHRDQRRLDMTLNELPISTDELFALILLRASQKSKVPQKLQVAILEFVTQAQHPVSLRELTHFIGIAPDKLITPKKADHVVRTACGPLIETGKKGAIQSGCESLTDYLYDKCRLRTVSDSTHFPVLNYEKVQGMLALKCLRHLATVWYTEWLESPAGSGYHGNTGWKLGDERTLQVKYPHLNYAAKNWHRHLEQAAATMGNDQILASIREVFEGNTDSLDAWSSWETEVERLRSYQKGFMTLSEAVRLDQGGRLARKRHKEKLRQSSWSLLHAAPDQGIAYLIRSILELGLQAGRTITQMTAVKHLSLPLAIRNRRHHIVKALLDYGVEIDEPDERGLKPLHIAVLHRDLKVVNLLLEAGVSPCTPKTREDPERWCGSSPGTYGDTPVKYACQEGSRDIMRVMSDFLTNEDVQRAICWALQYHQTDIAIDLLQRPGVDVNHHFARATLLFLACRVKDLRVMRYLLDSGADVHLLSCTCEENGGRWRGVGRSNELSPLHAFVVSEEGHGFFGQGDTTVTVMLEGLTLLLDAGIDPNIAMPDGSSITADLILWTGACKSSPTSMASENLELVLTFLFTRGLSRSTVSRDLSRSPRIRQSLSPDALDVLHRFGLELSTDDSQ